ncbi:uncharacterized protein METZ01_LOCUS473846, partial [marine metagenome]
NSDIKYGCVEFDAVGKDYIVSMTTATGAATNPHNAFMQFTYDDNDQFGTGGAAATLAGTPATQAAWITAMATNCAAGAAVTVTGIAGIQGGVRSSIAHVDYGALSTDIQRHTMG